MRGVFLFHHYMRARQRELRFMDCSFCSFVSTIYLQVVVVEGTAGDEMLVLNVDAIALFHLTHHESALDGGEIFYFAKFVKHKLLILFHVSCAYL